MTGVANTCVGPQGYIEDGIAKVFTSERDGNDASNTWFSIPQELNRIFGH